MSLLWQNVLYCTMFIVSGAIILSTLKRRKMVIAHTMFCILFGVLLVYVPFYFGGSLMIRVANCLFTDKGILSAFVRLTRETISAPFAYFMPISMLSAAIALICIAATVITAVTVTIKAVEYFRSGRREIFKIHRDARARAVSRLCFAVNNRYVYRHLGRFRN